jgi:hypothetical protein
MKFQNYFKLLALLVGGSWLSQPLQATEFPREEDVPSKAVFVNNEEEDIPPFDVSLPNNDCPPEIGSVLYHNTFSSCRYLNEAIKKVCRALQGTQPRGSWLSQPLQASEFPGEEDIPPFVNNEKGYFPWSDSDEGLPPVDTVDVPLSDNHCPPKIMPVTYHKFTFPLYNRPNKHVVKKARDALQEILSDYEPTGINSQILYNEITKRHAKDSALHNGIGNVLRHVKKIVGGDPQRQYRENARTLYDLDLLAISRQILKDLLGKYGHYGLSQSIRHYKETAEKLGLTVDEE